MVTRGLTQLGINISSNIRLICLCDECRKSFVINAYNWQMSYIDYFYSSDCSMILIKPTINKSFSNMSKSECEEIEKNLPIPSNGSGHFKIFNPFRCPYCKAVYIDFEKYHYLKDEEKECVYLNIKPTQIMRL